SRDIRKNPAYSRAGLYAPTAHRAGIRPGPCGSQSLSLEDEDPRARALFLKRKRGLACVFRSYHVVLAFKALRAAAAVLERVALRASLECCAAPWSGTSPSRQSRLRQIKEKSDVEINIHSEQQAASGRVHARHREG